MVEHRPVKAIVAGSSPASGAKEKQPGHKIWLFFLYFDEVEARTGGSGANEPRAEMYFEHGECV